MAASTLKVAIISPERTVYEGDADMVVAPAWDGEVGVLRGHAPMLVLLGAGPLRVALGGSERRFQVEGGFMQVANDVVTLPEHRLFQETARRRLRRSRLSRLSLAAAS